jgi:site-specific DNA-methyltransferase (adenine-specific)
MVNYKLYKGDCLELFKNIEDKSIDMILCDLPYEVTQNKKDIKIPFEPLWKNYERVIKDNGAIVLFAQGLFYIDLVNSNRKLFRYDIIWDKKLTTGFLNAKRMPLRQHEQIAVFYKKLPTYNPQFKKGKPLHSKGKSYIDKDPKNQNYGKFEMTDDSRAGSTDKYPTSIFTFQKPHPSVAVHRTEKPVDLLKELILTYTNPGELVLDNTMGSGSTGIAALEVGRRFIGIEMDKDDFKLASERIKNYDKRSY